MRAGTGCFQSATQASQWGFKIVRNIGRNLTQALHQFGNAIQHLVEGLRQSVEFVSAGTNRRALREIARYNRFGGPPYCFTRLRIARLKATPPIMPKAMTSAKADTSP